MFINIKETVIFQCFGQKGYNNFRDYIKLTNYQFPRSQVYNPVRMAASFVGFNSQSVHSFHRYKYLKIEVLWKCRRGQPAGFCTSRHP